MFRPSARGAIIEFENGDDASKILGLLLQQADSGRSLFHECGLLPKKTIRSPLRELRLQLKAEIQLWAAGAGVLGLDKLPRGVRSSFSGAGATIADGIVAGRSTARNWKRT